MVVFGMIAAGCGKGSASGAKAGAISVTSSGDALGQVSSLEVASTVQLSMTPSGDSINAGVDWVVACGGNPVTGSVSNGSCGTLSPAHTSDGATTTYTAPSVVPIGTTVTITASTTQNPSQSSRVSLTIVPVSIAIQFGNSVPSSLALMGTLNISAVVTNDPAGGLAGVNWTVTCGSSNCGSFSTAITHGLSVVYTAPATKPTGGTVTIFATSTTDPTKFANATIAIGSAASSGGPVSISLSSTSVNVQTAGAAHTAHFTAVVTNGTAGVDWSVSCGSSACGSMSPTHTANGVASTFTAPSTTPAGGTVTIAATSTDDPTVSATATATFVTATPIIVAIPSASLPPATLPVGSQFMLSATTSAGTLGVDWTATCGSAGLCGTFNLTPAHTASAGKITYTAPSNVPAGSVVTITAASSATTPSNSASALTTIVVLPSVTFAQSPPATLAGGTQASVSAIVTNDLSPGGVTWTVKCGSVVAGGCGAIVPYQTASGGVATYTAPPVSSSGTAVTINATSTADSLVSISSTSIAIGPSTSLAINFVPSAPSQIQANATMNLAAAVSNDTANAGTDWEVCASGCGFFTIAPTIPAVPATSTTPAVPTIPAITATTVTAWPNNLPLSYTAPTQAPSSGSVVVLVAAHASPATATSAMITVNAASSGPALQGVVQAGSQPVAGASVALYAAGASGYASASSQISAPGGTASSTTDKNGAFTIPAGFNCLQPNSQMYLVATGGEVGTNAANPNLALMTALGSCSSLSSASVVVNEVTTIASAFATANFAANDALTGNSSYLYIGASSTNVTGLANAFAVVNNLVDISNGKVRFTVPAGNAAVPYVEIDTLADILNACAASPGGVEGDGSVCGNLFTATDLLGTGTYSASIAPSDTLQAAFNIAQHPASNYGYSLDKDRTLLGLATLASPFQPILSAPPNDWSISLNYTGGGGLSPASAVGSFAIDATGNIWITDTKAGSVIEWNAVGAALSPSTGFPAGGGPIAVDATGNVWISGNGSLTELSSLGTPIPGSPFGGVDGGSGDIAIDANGNVWTTDTSGVSEFNNIGLEISPSNGYTNSGVTGTLPIAIDNSNNVWVGNDGSGAYVMAELTNPGGQLIVNSSQAGLGLNVMSQIAADGSGNIWTPVASSGGACLMPPYGGKGTVLLPTCFAGADTQEGAPYFIFNPRGIALDGAGAAWVASQGGGSSPVVPPGVTPIIPSLNGGGNIFESSTLAIGPLRLAVDGSGNVWVLLNNNTVTEYIGLATPVVTPIAMGVKNKKLGAKP